MRLMSKKKGPIPPLILLFVVIIQLLTSNYLSFLTIEIFFINWIGYIIISLGLLMLVTSIMKFRKLKTTVIVFKKPTSLVTTKIYSLTRNPMYLSMFFILLGLGLLSNNAGSIVTAFLFIPLMNQRIIKHEESMLVNEFQDEYNLYKNKVRRWI